MLLIPPAARTLLLLVLGVCVFPPQVAQAQIAIAETNPYLRLGDVTVTQYRVGVSITPSKGAVQNIVAMVAVPHDWPEQTVEIVDEDVSSNIEYDFRLLRGGGARQLLLRIPYLSGTEAHAIVTYEVRTRVILPPEDTSTLSIPAKPDRDLKQYLGRSPFIETRHSKIRKAVREALATLEAPAAEQADHADDQSAESQPEPAVEATSEEKTEEKSEEVPAEPAAPTDWQRVKAIYDYVQEKIEYVEGPDNSAVRTLQEGTGDCQSMSALFVAMCRTQKIPARIVWVHEHNYAEFCLVDPEGQPHWFPCEVAGAPAFGEMPQARTILQKGDSFRVPERPRDTLRYASNFMVGEGLPGSGKPKVRYIQEQL